jgi:hypothetical protein
MTWEQKLQAIAALVGLGRDVSLIMRHPGNWYVSCGLERKEGGLLSGGLVQAPDPATAVEHYWNWLTDERYYIVVNAMRDTRKAVKWNGFMWADVQEEF